MLKALKRSLGVLVLLIIAALALLTWRGWTL